MSFFIYRFIYAGGIPAFFCLKNKRNLTFYFDSRMIVINIVRKLIISKQIIGGYMNQSFHYLIMINQAMFNKKVLSKLMKLGLTPGQPKVLDYLSIHNGSMQKDIAKGCQIDPATLTGILERMEEKGLVERRMMKGNRRSSYVFLTERGWENGKKIADIFLEIETKVFKGIKEKDREQFMDVFYKISCNMKEMEELQ